MLSLFSQDFSCSFSVRGRSLSDILNLIRECGNKLFSRQIVYDRSYALSFRLQPKQQTPLFPLSLLNNSQRGVHTIYMIYRSLIKHS